MIVTPCKLLQRGRRSLTPPEKVLRQVGLSYLDPSYMFYPNDPSRSAGNRHYLYSAAGWNAGTLSRGDIKNRVNVSGGVLVSDAAGVLGPNGQIEVAGTKLNPALDGFTVGGTVTKTSNQSDLIGGTSAIKLTEKDTKAESFHFINCALTAPANSRISIECYAKRGAGARNLALRILTASGSAWVSVNLGNGTVMGQYKLGDGVAATDAFVVAVGNWYFCRFSAIASASVANPSFYVYMIADDGTIFSYDGDGASSIFLAHAQSEIGAYPTTWINGADGATRAADALRFTGLSGLTLAGGALVFFRAPYVGSTLDADQYHVGINGSDSKDNGAFLFTKASDDKLYAELRSGGVQQATVDLGEYTAGTQYAIAMDWDASGLRAAINGVEKTASGAVTVPASIDRLEVGRGISTDTAHGGETPGILLFNRALTTSERATLTGATMRSTFFAGI